MKLSTIGLTVGFILLYQHATVDVLIGQQESLQLEAHEFEIDSQGAVKFEYPTETEFDKDTLESLVNDKAFEIQFQRAFRRRLISTARDVELQEIVEIIDSQKPKLRLLVKEHEQRVERSQKKLKKAFEKHASSSKDEQDLKEYKTVVGVTSKEIRSSFDKFTDDIEGVLLPHQLSWLRKLAMMQAMPKAFRYHQTDVRSYFLLAAKSGLAEETLEKLREVAPELQKNVLKRKIEAERKAIEEIITSFPKSRQVQAKNILIGEGTSP